MKEEVIKRIKEMIDDGLPLRLIAEKTSYDKTHIRSVLKKSGMTTEEMLSKVKNKYKINGKKYRFIDANTGKLIFIGSRTEAKEFFHKSNTTIWRYVHGECKAIKTIACDD